MKLHHKPTIPLLASAVFAYGAFRCWMAGNILMAVGLAIGFLGSAMFPFQK